MALLLPSRNWIHWQLNEANNRFMVVENASSSKGKCHYFLVTETELLDKLDNLK